MKKRILSLAAECLLLFQLCACSKDGSGKRVIFPVDAEPEYLDPQIASTVAERNIVINCFEGLMAYDESGTLVPAAAESVDVSSDGRTYTFRLRGNMHWMLTSSARGVLGDAAEGFDDRLTAADYVFGLQRALDPETHAPVAPLLLSIENAREVNAGALPPAALGVEAVDDGTVVIRLSRSDATLLATLTEPGCMPCNEAFFAATSGRYGLSPAYLMSNGPFYISNWSSGTAITIRKNESYHASGSVKPASVYFSINNDWATRADKVKSGTYEVSPVTAVQAAALSGEKNLSVRRFENATYGLLFNCADEILSNFSLRKAIAASFDPAALLESKKATAAQGVLPEACRFGDRTYRAAAGTLSMSTEDKARIKKRFEAGLEKLGLREVDLTVLCVQEDEMAVRAVMQQWQSAFGVKFSSSVEVLGSVDLEQRILKGEYQLAFAPLKVSTASAIGALRQFLSAASATDPLHLTNKKTDAAIEEAMAAESESACLAALKEAEQTLIDAAAFVPICPAQTSIATAKGVSGVIASPAGDRIWFRQVTVK